MRIFFLLSVLCASYCIAMDKAPLVEDLFEAIISDKKSMVESIIGQYPHLIKSCSKKKHFFSDKASPLHVAAAYGSHYCINLLLASKADPNCVTKINCNTPLHYVRTVKGARLLLAAGAKVNQENADGRTPFWRVLIPEEFNKEAIIRTHQQMNAIAPLLFTEDMDINKKDKLNATLLHYAMCHKAVYAIDFLLRNKADQDQQDGLGVTPFDMFIKNRESDEIAHIFARYGTFFFPYMSPRTLFADDYAFLNNWAPVFSYMNAKKDMGKNYSGSDIGPMRGGVMCNQYGCIAKNVSYKDLEQLFGQSEVKVIENNLQAQCKKVISLVCSGDHKALKEKIDRFPFVTSYRDIFTKLMLKEAIIITNNARCLAILLNNTIVERIINSSVLEWGPKAYTQKGTFLHLAVFYDNVLAIKLLMRYGADCLLLDNLKRTPMAYAQALQRHDCITQLNASISEQFLIAFYTGEYKKSKQLLEQIVDCNVFTIGGNPLLHNIIHCADNKIKKFIALLVAKGAHPDELNEDGETTLWHLMRFDKNALDIFEDLLRFGGRVDRLSPKTHYSLLGLAVHCKKIELVKLFLQYGALISKKMLEDASGKMKLLLEQSFNGQKCYLCTEHKDNLSDILCKNRHMHKFICVACYNKANADNNQCPFCFQRLN